jgi:hypothetical protein
MAQKVARFDVAKGAKDAKSTLGIRDHVDVGAVAAVRQLARHLV